MTYKAFGIQNRASISDSIRSQGYKFFGTKGFYGPYFNEALFKSVQDYILGTEDQVKVQELATIYYASTSNFKDKNDNVITLADYDRINIIIDQMERDIVFPAIKLEFSAHSLVDMNGFDITIADEVGGRIELDGPGIINVSGQSNLLKIPKKNTLSYVDADDQGDVYKEIWYDGTFIFCTCGTSGLRTYSFDSDGILTYIDTDYQAHGSYNGVWGDGTFIYVSSYTAGTTGGILSYSVDGSGNLTFIDYDGQGTGEYYDVSGDGTFIYCACYTEGLRSYSVDGSGNLTYIDVDDQGGIYFDVESDGSFIYVAASSAGLLSYSSDISGNLTFIDSISGTHNRLSIGSNYIYSIVTTSIYVTSVDGSGNLSFESSAGYYSMEGLKAEGDKIYLAGASTGGGYGFIHNNTTIPVEYDKQGIADYSGVVVVNDLIFFACVTDGVRSYKLISDNDVHLNFTGTGSILSGGDLVTP